MFSFVKKVQQIVSCVKQMASDHRPSRWSHRARQQPAEQQTTSVFMLSKLSHFHTCTEKPELMETLPEGLCVGTLNSMIACNFTTGQYVSVRAMDTLSEHYIPGSVMNAWGTSEPGAPGSFGKYVQVCPRLLDCVQTVNFFFTFEQYCMNFGQSSY